MTGGRIADLRAWQALDSRGKPTVACRITLDGGASAVVSVPSGASTGRYEAVELRDGSDAYFGNGVLMAVAAVNGPVAEALHGAGVHNQQEIDGILRDLDGTSDLSRLGANAVLAASLACLCVAASSSGLELWRALDPDVDRLPRPMVNIVSGGAHADGLISIQDVLFVPTAATTFAEAIAQSVEVRAATAEVLTAWGFDCALIADEGGLAAPLGSSERAVEAVLRGIERAGLVPGRSGGIAIDVAASQFAQPAGYLVDGSLIDAGKWLERLSGWVADYPIVLIEDPFDQDDWTAWEEAARSLPLSLVADDLTATQVDRVREVVQRRAAGTLLVKVNQAGTVSGAKAALDAARQGGLGVVVSARSGETEDSWLSDLAVGWRADLLKVGSTMRSERTAKWNRVMQIEQEHGICGLATLPTVEGI